MQGRHIGGHKRRREDAYKSVHKYKRSMSAQGEHRKTRKFL
jgi:hypothetical protein